MSLKILKAILLKIATKIQQYIRQTPRKRHPREKNHLMQLRTLNSHRSPEPQTSLRKSPEPRKIPRKWPRKGPRKRPQMGRGRERATRVLAKRRSSARLNLLHNRSVSHANA